METYTYDRGDGFERQAAEPEDDLVLEDFTELQIAEYAVFLFALDTYVRYLVETSGKDDTLDDVAVKGMRLARFVESQHDATIRGFFEQHLPNTTLQRMVQRGFRLRPNADGIAQRALQLRTALSRGGTATMRAVFQSQKAILALRAAINAAMIDDADAALDKFAVITMRNTRLRDWIDLAAKTAGSGAPPGAVSAATDGVGETATQVAEKTMTSSGQTGSIASAEASEARNLILQKVQAEAKVTAQKALDQAKEPDIAPTRSDVVAIATAAAVAATSDPSNNRNVPAALAFLSEENRAVALMGGRVRVSAGAGSGKSTTLCARVAYLVQEKGVDPSTILVTSFNKKAADELKTKVAKACGSEAAEKMTIGTMHSIFLTFIQRYGTPAQKGMFLGRSVDKATGQSRMGTRILKDSQIMRPIFKAWEKCFPPAKDANGEKLPFPDAQVWKNPPKPRRMRAYLNKFQGDGWTVAQAQDWARTSREPEHIQAAVFYEFYEGFKGAFGPSWSPRACANITKTQEYVDVSTRVRGGAARGGDFSDMLVVFRNVIRDNPDARKALQDQYQHVKIDECQDLNLVQAEAFLALTQGIATDDEKKSIWMVGDKNQSIFSFRGADPKQFQDLDQHGFKTGYMKTNRRSLPEIVEAANRLIAHNEDQLMVQVPLADKPRGAASIVVTIPDDNTGAAVTFANRVKEAQLEGKPLEQYAVLARTNKELHNFETACIIRGTPYVRKGASSFLAAPEAKTFMSFIDLASSNDPARLAAGLAEALVATKRLRSVGFKPEPVEDAIWRAMERYAHGKGTNAKDVNPIGAALTDPNFRTILARSLSTRELSPFIAEKDADIIYELINEIAEIRTRTSKRETDEGTPYKTSDLFADILTVKCVERAPDESGTWIEKERTLKDKLVQQLKFADLDKDEELEGEEVEGDEPLGAISFFKEMLKPDPTEPDLDPENPVDFRLRVDRYKTRAKDLRIDPNEWEKKNPGVKPPGAYLATCHATKGAEWEDVTVLMPVGTFPFFPMPRKPKPDECPEVPIHSDADEMESERRLGYVALTRAVKNLTVVCPYEAVLARLPRGAMAPPREAAISQFVREAELHLGENVKPEAATGPSLNAIAEGVADVPDPTVKTAYTYGRETFVACGCEDDPLGPTPETHITYERI